jgi:hypothetical protein
MRYAPCTSMSVEVTNGCRPRAVACAGLPRSPNPVISRTGRSPGLQLESGKVSDARSDLVAALS